MPRAEVGRDVIHHPAVGEIAEHGRRVRVAADADALAHLGRAGRRVRRRAHQLETLLLRLYLLGHYALRRTSWNSKKASASAWGASGKKGEARTPQSMMSASVITEPTTSKLRIPSSIAHGLS